MSKAALALALAGMAAGCSAVSDLGHSIDHALKGDETTDVALVGTVTDASGGTVSVNGVAIDTTPETVLNGPVAPLGTLQGGSIPPGHVVELVAERSAGRLTAREIEPIHALAGPVTSTRGGLYVMGAEVVPIDGAILPRGGMGGFRTGQNVAVSGLWQGDRVIASRIDYRTRKRTQLATIAGVVKPTPGARYAIGPVPVAAEMGDLHPGQFHAITGRWVVGTVLADEIRVGRTVIGRHAVDTISVEGYARARDFAGFYSGYPGPDRGGYFDGYTFTGREGKFGDDPAWRDRWQDLDGLGRPVGRADDVADYEGTRAIYLGDLRGGADGRFKVDTVIPVPDGAADRASTLAAVGDGLDPQAGAESD